MLSIVINSSVKHYSYELFKSLHGKSLQACCQLVTVGIDGNVMFWDIRMQKPTGAAGLGTLGSTTKKERETAKEKFSSIPSTFSHLDLQVRESLSYHY